MSSPNPNNSATSSTGANDSSSMPQPLTRESNERMGSLSSAACFEQDEYGDYDDFGLSHGGGGGGGGGRGNAKMNRRQDNRGGSGGSGSVYSAKHIRAKEAQHHQQNKTKK